MHINIIVKKEQGRLLELRRLDDRIVSKPEEEGRKLLEVRRKDEGEKKKARIEIINRCVYEREDFN